MLYEFCCKRISLIVMLSLLFSTSYAQEKETRHYKIFQFPADKIPAIDGNKTDWDIVPDSFAIGTDQLVDDNHHFPAPDPKNLDVKVKVGWVKGMNRLYFLY